MMQDLFEETLTHAHNGKDLLNAVQDDRDLLLWAIDSISSSPSAFALIRMATNEGWDLGIDNLGTGGFHLEMPEKKIYIDHYGLTAESLVRSSQYKNAFLLTLIQSLRDLAQELRFGALEQHYKPESVLMLERVRAADAQCYATLVAWEMRGAGRPDFWRYILGSEDGDLAMTMNNVLECDPRAFMDGSAMAQVFRQWFLSDYRITVCDHETLEALDMVMEWAQDNGNKDNPFGDKALESSVIEELCLLTNGVSYLQGMGDSICADPAFSVMNDPINEAHLFQIVYDTQVHTVEHVPFRDPSLAKKLFPDGKIH